MRYSTQDKKYDIEHNRLINAASGEPIPADEPIFIFRAKDKHLLKVLAEYRMMCENDEHVGAVEQREVEISEWQQRTRHRIGEPDTKDV